MGATEIRLVSWNVNGLRAIFKKDFTDSMEKLGADVLMVQETKLQEPQLTSEMTGINGLEAHWSFSTVKKGYSGVGAWTQSKPIAVRHGIGMPEFDDEGRILELEYEAFTLFNVYFPNGQQSDERLDYKLRFYEAFFAYTNALKDKGRPIIICGDVNTAHNEIDLRHPKPNAKRSGFLPVEREWLDRILSMGYVDTFRHLYPEEEKYSWWSYRFNARKSNAGWRIDYFYVSQDILDKGWIKNAWIDNETFGSDHCPVGLDLLIP
ncbi:exodeoxyribonuclease III [Desulfoluna sp.]|uniref:exodeoxyribonuclease III n=1 Tax=Desulfoluna sp. TaxID=2045199 RepID=UPI0026383D5D|nr:exodeoxyribonuclease III [Desulfoluna sp.]